jgi:hypothetical protein
MLVLASAWHLCSSSSVGTRELIRIIICSCCNISRNIESWVLAESGTGYPAGNNESERLLRMAATSLQKEISGFQQSPTVCTS